MPPKSTPEKGETGYDVSGTPINHYIPTTPLDANPPDFIANAPWYLNEATQDYLAHQRADPKQPVISHTEPVAGKGITEEVILESEVAVKRFAKGSCGNCGSMSHLRGDCLERPTQKQGSAMARTSTRTLVKRNDDYDSKRDRWFGYDTNDWNERERTWLARERQLKADEMKREVLVEEARFRGEVPAATLDFALELAELGLAEPLQTEETIVDDSSNPTEKGKSTIRDRYDKPSYLVNLTESGYDPKSRITKDKNKGFINDRSQFVRYLTGEAAEYERTKHFAWEKDKREARRPTGDAEPLVANMDLNPEASPTAVLLAQREVNAEKEKARAEKKRKLLEMYGGK